MLRERGNIHYTYKFKLIETLVRVKLIAFETFQSKAKKTERNEYKIQMWITMIACTIRKDILIHSIYHQRDKLYIYSIFLINQKCLH